MQAIMTTVSSLYVSVNVFNTANEEIYCWTKQERNGQGRGGHVVHMGLPGVAASSRKTRTDAVNAFPLRCPGELLVLNSPKKLMPPIDIVVPNERQLSVGGEISCRQIKTYVT